MISIHLGVIDSKRVSGSKTWAKKEEGVRGAGKKSSTKMRRDLPGKDWEEEDRERRALGSWKEGQGNTRNQEKLKKSRTTVGIGRKSLRHVKILRKTH